MITVHESATLVHTDGICEHVTEHPHLAPLISLLVSRGYGLGERREILAAALAFESLVSVTREDLLRPADALDAEIALALGLGIPDRPALALAPIAGGIDLAEPEPEPCKCHAGRPDVETGRAIVRAVRAAGSPLAVPRALMPPIGGVPAYEPSAADWAEFEDWLDTIDFPRVKDAADRRRDMADVALWYQQHPEG